MGHVKTFYMEDNEEISRLLRNLDRIQRIEQKGLSPIIVAALKDYVERWMRLNERQTTFNEEFVYHSEEPKPLEGDLIAIRSVIANRSGPTKEDLDWLNSPARLKAIEEAEKLKPEPQPKKLGYFRYGGT